MKKLLAELKVHPGTPIAASLTVLGAIAGSDRGPNGWLIGVAFMSIFWIPVIYTAWENVKTRNLDRDP